MIIKKIKQKIFRTKLKKLGFNMNDMENVESEKLLLDYCEKTGTQISHILECFKDTLVTKKLQDVCEKLSGRKNAGRYLQYGKKPIVIQCNTCGKDFAEKSGVIYVDEAINLGSLENIIMHLITCEGVRCSNCGTKKPYLNNCKNCGLGWEKCIEKECNGK